MMTAVKEASIAEVIKEIKSAQCQSPALLAREDISRSTVTAAQKNNDTTKEINSPGTPSIHVEERRRLG